MAEPGWVRSKGDRAEKEGLRRGGWYRIVEDSGKPWVVVDVHQVEVRVPRDNLEVRKDRQVVECRPRAPPRLPGVPQAAARLRTAEGREVPRVRQHVQRGLDGPRLKAAGGKTPPLA